MGKGGGGAPQPTSQNVTQTNLPEYARPYFEDLMKRGQETSQVQYQPYGGERTAGFTPLQEQAFQGIQNLGPSPLLQPATGLTGAAGLGGLSAGQQYQQMATNPSAMQAYMSPYMQNVVDYQKTKAIQDYARQLPGMQATATNVGGLGGTRRAIVESEAQRNLQNQLAGIQAQGTQSAFDTARQAQQFGSQLGLQGLGLTGQMGAQLGQLGQTAFGQQAATAQAQQQAGAAQQALSQDILNKRYEDFMQQTLYPQSQLQFYSSLLRGVPIAPQQTMYQYQAPASTANQLLSAGLGAYGVNKMFSKEGGEIKGYAEGGAVKGYAVGGNVANPQAQYEMALRMPIERLQQIVKGMPAPIEQGVALLVLNQKKQTQTAMEGEQAQAQLNQPTIKDRILGLNGLADMDIPEGGIAGEPEEVEGEEPLQAAAQGGPIRFQDRGEVPFLVSPELSQMFGFRQAKKSKEAQKLANERASAAGQPLPFPEVGYLETKPETAFQRSSTGMYTLPEENPILAPQQGIAGLTENAVVPATVAAPKAKPKTKAAPKDSDIAVGRYAQEPDAAGSGPSSIYPTATGAQAAPLSEDEMIRQYAEKAAGYMQEPREAFRRAQQTATAEREKELAGMREESKGVAALRAAAELSKSGRQGIESLGAAFGAAGEAGAAFGKEQRTALREKRASDLEAAKAEMAFKQGDYELGARLMHKSEDLKLKAADLAGMNARHEAALAMEGKKLSETERKNNLDYAYHMAYVRAYGGNKGQITPALAANISNQVSDDIDKQLSNALTYRDYQKMYPGKSKAEIKTILAEQEFKKRVQAFGGIANLATASTAPAAPLNLNEFSIREKTGR